MKEKYLEQRKSSTATIEKFHDYLSSDEIENDLVDPTNKTVFHSASIAFLEKYIANALKQIINTKIDDKIKPRQYSELLYFNSSDKNHVYYLRLRDWEKHHNKLKEEASKPLKELPLEKVLPLPKQDSSLGHLKIFKSPSLVKSKSFSILRLLSKLSSKKSSSHVTDGSLSELLESLRSKYNVKAFYSCATTSKSHLSLDTVSSHDPSGFKKPVKYLYTSTIYAESSNEKSQNENYSIQLGRGESNEAKLTFQVAIEEGEEEVLRIFKNQAWNTNSEDCSREILAAQTTNETYPISSICSSSNNGELLGRKNKCRLESSTKFLYSHSDKACKLESKLSVCIDDDVESDEECCCCFDRNYSSSLIEQIRPNERNVIESLNLF